MNSIKKSSGNGGAPASPATDEIYEAYRELGIANEGDRDRIAEALALGYDGVKFKGELTVGGETFPVEGSLMKIGREQ